MSSERSAGVSPAIQSRASYLPLFSLAVAAVAAFRIFQFFRELPIAAAFQYDYEEGNILNALLRITHGSTPYPDPHALPNIINPYGPAAYYLLVIPVKLFGLSFFYPRVMVLLCTVVIAGFIALEIRRATASWVLGATLATIFLCLPNVQEWMWLLRVDLLGIAFSVAGLVLLSRELEHHPDHPRVLPAAILFAVALLVKPTLAAAPAACFFALLVRRHGRAAGMLTVLTAAICAAVIGCFAWLTHGAVLTDVFFSHPDPFSFRVYTEGMTAMLQMSWPLVILAAIGVARDIARRRYSPAVLWLAFATMTAITAGKLGSNKNHFLEWNAALCIAAGIGLDVLAKLPSRRFAIVANAVAVAAIALVISNHPRYLDNFGPDSECPRAYEWVRSQAGANILSENVGALVLGNKKVWVSNPFVLAQLVEHAGWSDAELVTMVRERHFDAIFTRMDYPSIPSVLATGAERFSPALLLAIRENYTHQQGFLCRDMNILYTPKPAIQSK
jgi:hypothetical protein